MGNEMDTAALSTSGIIPILNVFGRRECLIDDPTYRIFDIDSG
jgi:hypothetical protein